MAQPPRINVPGTTHHVIVRGNNRRMIFDTDTDRQLFERLFFEAAASNSWSLLAWCIMGNHAHLALTTPTGSLSQGMQVLLNRYARAHNRRYDRTDHCFRSRFWSHAIDSDLYLVSAIAYIHRNPIRSGLVEHAQDWISSSYRQLMGTEPTIPSLDWKRALGVIHPNPTYARPALDQLIHHSDGNPPPAEPPERPTLNQIVTAMGPSLAIAEATRRGHSHRAIAEALGVTRSTVSHRLRRQRR